MEYDASPQSSISVVVPVYNGQETLTELTSRLTTVLRPITSDFEIIYVNDGSQDDSWNAIEGLSSIHPFVVGINLMRNYGQHNALLAGVLHAKKEMVVTMDDDLQHPPEEIPCLLNKCIEGYDLVYGRPIQREHDIWRNISSALLKAVMRLVLGERIGAQSSAFRAFRADLRSGFTHFSDAQLSLDVLLSWSAESVAQIPVSHHSRKYGRSNYTPKKLILMAFNILMGYSTLPLRIASSVGLVTSIFGIGMFFYVVIRRLLQPNNVPGFAFIASEIAIFAGLQLFAIGIIGEYLARLHFRTMGKPPYVIRETTLKGRLRQSINQ